MYLLIKRYEKRTIRKYIRLNGLECVYSSEDIEDLAGDMAMWFMDQYQRPEFAAETMSAYGHWAFVKIMHDPNRKARDQRRKALAEMEPVTEEKDVFSLDVFETSEERKERVMNDQVAPGEYQGVLPFEEWEKAANENV